MNREKSLLKITLRRSVFCIFTASLGAAVTFVGVGNHLALLQWLGLAVVATSVIVGGAFIIYSMVSVFLNPPRSRR